MARSGRANKAGEYSDSRLTVSDYRCLLMFLAHCMFTTQLFDVTCEEEYPDVSDEDCFKAATNIL